MVPWQVSTSGGIIRSGDGIRKSCSLDPATPVALLQTRIVGGGQEAGQGLPYVSFEDRFFINELDETTSPIRPIQNWQPPH